MKVFPSENLTLISQLSKVEIYDKINSITGKERDFKTFSFGHNKQFEGIISVDSFKITRILPYRNSFLPIIYGQIKTFNSGSKIMLDAKMGKFQLIFFAIWTILLGLLSLASIFFIVMEFINAESQIWTFIVPIMFLVGYGYMQISFSKETQKTKEILIQLLQAKEITKENVA